MQEIEFKTGDTFLVDMQRVDDAGAPVSLAGVTVTAGIKGREFEDTLDVAIVDESAGTFQVSKDPAATALWPGLAPGVYSKDVMFMDARYDDGATVFHSKTIKVIVNEGIAQ